MMREAQNDLLLMSDSDIRVTPEMLRVIASEFQRHPARRRHLSVPGCGRPKLLVGTGSVRNEHRVLGRRLHSAPGGARRSILPWGQPIAARRKVIDSVGGWDRLSRYLAEDLRIGAIGGRGWLWRDPFELRD